MPAPPDTRLVASLRGAVQPLVHSPEAVQTARISGVSVVDNAALEHKRAHAGPLARVSVGVSSGHGCVHGDRLRDRRRVHGVTTPLVVVLNGPLALLLLGESHAEVRVEVVAER